MTTASDANAALPKATVDTTQTTTSVASPAPPRAISLKTPQPAQAQKPALMHKPDSAPEKVSTAKNLHTLLLVGLYFLIVCLYSHHHCSVLTDSQDSLYANIHGPGNVLPKQHPAEPGPAYKDQPIALEDLML